MSGRLPRQDRLIGPLFVGAAFVVFVAAASLYFFAPLPSRDPPRVAAAPNSAPNNTSASAAAAKTGSQPAPSSGPSFDIVRVAPDGHAVVAGRAEPGATVTLRDGGRDLGSAKADGNGEFVLVPEQRLGPGSRELTLAARDATGQERAGQGSVVVLIEPPLAAAEAAPAQAERSAAGNAGLAAPAAAERAGPVAVLLPSGDAPPRVLQAPASPGKLALNTVDYGEQGDIRFGGSAKPSAPVRVYVDNRPVGETQTSPTGNWTLAPPAQVAPGVHRLRVDQLTRSGEVQSRVEVPFQRTALPGGGAIARERTVVQPGQTLWRIARATYGSGVRYTVIYLANRDQIRNPNLIYPGQIFAVPGATP